MFQIKPPKGQVRKIKPDFFDETLRQMGRYTDGDSGETVTLNTIIAQ